MLRCELARKNMYVKDEPVHAKRPRFDAPPAYANYAPPAGMMTLLVAVLHILPPCAATVPPRMGSANLRMGGDNPPCNTLFVANLGEHCTEPELEQFFSQFAGYRQSKVMRTPRSVTAFIEFADVPTATHVHAAQQVRLYDCV